MATSNLANYPSNGSVIGIEIRTPLGSESAGNSQVGPIFGAADLTNWYSARFGAVQDDFALFVKDSGVQSAVDPNNDPGGFYTAGDVLVIEVSWDDGTYRGADNDETARLMARPERRSTP